MSERDVGGPDERRLEFRAGRQKLEDRRRSGVCAVRVSEASSPQTADDCAVTKAIRREEETDQPHSQQRHSLRRQTHDLQHLDLSRSNSRTDPPGGKLLLRAPRHFQHRRRRTTRGHLKRKTRPIRSNLNSSVPTPTEEKTPQALGRFSTTALPRSTGRELRSIVDTVEAIV